MKISSYWNFTTRLEAVRLQISRMEGEYKVFLHAHDKGEQCNLECGSVESTVESPTEDG